MKSCREITRIVLEGEDRRLGLGERLAVRLHLSVCDACTRFRAQVKLMNQAMGQWRRYTEGDSDDSR